MNADNLPIKSEEDLLPLPVSPQLVTFGDIATRYLLRERILGSMHFWSANMSSRRQRRPVREKEIIRYIWMDGAIRKMTLVAYAAGDLGFPTAVDFELFLGLEHLLLDRIKQHHYLDPVIRFQGHEVLDRAGKDTGGREYQELNRCLMRLKGLTIGLGSQKTSATGEVHARSRRPTFLNMLRKVTLPGSVTKEGMVADAYEIQLEDWYWESLLAGNCFVVDRQLFHDVKGHIAKLLHQLLSHMFYLGNGSAMQSYSELVEGFELARYTAISQVRQQLGPAHEELRAHRFLTSWELVPVKGSKPRDFMLMWEAGPAWREAEQELANQRKWYELGESEPAPKQITHIDDPVLMIADAELDTRSREERAASSARLLQVILDLSGRRRDPHVWVKMWERALNTVPHPMIWRRVHEVKERVARGEKLNAGSYLYDLVKRDAAHLKVPWAIAAVERNDGE